MRTIPGLILLAACGVDDANPTRPPPTGGLELTIEGWAAPGATVTAEVTGADANARVLLGVSPTQTDSAICPPALAGACLDLANPRLVASATADALGEATLTFTVPSRLQGPDTLWFQAAQRTPNVRISAVHPKILPGPIGVAEPYHHLNVTRVAPDRMEGRFTHSWYGVDGQDACVLRTPVVGTPWTGTPCAGCDFAFTYAPSGPAIERTVAGDCATTTGQQAPFWSFPAFPLAWDSDYLMPSGPVGTMLYMSYGQWRPFAVYGGNYHAWGGGDYDATTGEFTAFQDYGAPVYY